MGVKGRTLHKRLHDPSTSGGVWGGGGVWVDRLRLCGGVWGVFLVVGFRGGGGAWVDRLRLCGGFWVCLWGFRVCFLGRVLGLLV